MQWTIFKKGKSSTRGKCLSPESVVAVVVAGNVSLLARCDNAGRSVICLELVGDGGDVMRLAVVVVDWARVAVDGWAVAAGEDSTVVSGSVLVAAVRAVVTLSVVEDDGGSLFVSVEACSVAAELALADGSDIVTLPGLVTVSAGNVVFGSWLALCEED